MNTAKKNLSRPALKLTPQEKIEFEVAHILLKSERFTSVQNKVTRVLSVLQGLTLIFWRTLKMRNELKIDLLNSIQNVTVL